MDLTAYPARGIREAREARGLSQSAVGRVLGVGPDRISKWERGECAPGAGWLGRLADALDCTVDSLLGRTISAQSSAPVNACPAEDTVKP